MSNGMEKLVGEIAYLISEKAEYDIETDLYDGLPMGTTMINSHEIARRAIALIGKAIADGVPLPGEVGRIEGVLAEEIIDHFFKGTELSGVQGNVLIALRKEKGGE